MFCPLLPRVRTPWIPANLLPEFAFLRGLYADVADGRRWIWWMLSLLLCVCLAAPAVAQPRNAGFAWIEGETPVSANVKFQAAGWGHSEFLSGQKWLQVSIDADKVEKELPAGGAVLEYRFQAPTSGKYEIWNRIGYEFVRSPFEWRVDAGAWARIGPEQLTTDLMELQDWNEVAWLKMGDRPLTPGAHTLFIRLPKTLDDKGRTAKVLYASDALCVHLGAWTPYSHFKPGQDWRDAKDREAAKMVFQAPSANSTPTPVELSLAGQWEVCRNDEQTPGEVAAPIRDFPAEPRWKAIAVPSDKMQKPELVMAHRLWYRTRLNVPAADAGRSFQMIFPQNNLNTTVYVNKIYCGFNKNPYARFAIDITKGVKPGVNEIWVGIRDAYYGYSANPKDPMKLRRKFNLPLSFSHQGFQELAYPVWGAFQSGILVAPQLVIGGPVYAADVFVKPSVARKELTAEVTLTNTTAKAVSGTVECRAVSVSEGRAGGTPAWAVALSFSLGAGETKMVTVSKAWGRLDALPGPTRLPKGRADAADPSDPKLWWPDSPSLYSLAVLVKPRGAPVDIHYETFGFREWTIDGIHLKLNGINYHAYGDAHGDGTPDEWLAAHQKSHQTAMRFWGTEWKGMPPEEALSWMDRKGLVVRRQGMLDGEAIGYMAIENDPALKELYKSDVKMDLMQNWKDQMVAQVKGERNHPSIMVWSIENEWLYINCINLYAGMMDKFEAEVAKVSYAVQDADPTRPTMTDGGGATKDQSMPLHGNHYVSGPMQQYPTLAYEDNVEGGGRGRWVWDRLRPRFLGEDFFFAGNHPELSAIGGEAVFAGKQAQLPASSLMQRILHEGYRWADFAGWDLYVQTSDGDGSQYNSLSPRAVLCREWDWTFGAGQQVKRTLAIFNDTHYDEPITFSWAFTLEGQRVAAQTSLNFVPPGKNMKLEITLPIPDGALRKEGQLALALSVKGQEVFRDVKAVSVLPSLAAVPASSGLEKLTAESVAVFDPAGGVANYLSKLSVPFTPIANLDALPERAKVLVVGRDALDLTESTSSRLAAYAAGGRAVIVLEQKNPLKFQALPAQIEAAENEGRAAFAEDLSHPVLRGLQQKDFFAWGPDEIVYRNAYVKPQRGGRSLIQCDNLLQNSALVEIPAGNGVLLLSQLALEEKLAGNAVAQKLLANLLVYGAEYKLTYRTVATALEPGSPAAKAVDAVGLNYSKAADPLQAISQPGAVAVVAATPANLRSLAANPDKVGAFTEGGGWLVLNGLTPEGLADYNKIVGFEHMIRPFKRERVTFPPVRSPLTAGIPTGDVVMYSGQRIFNWQEGNYVVSDEFKYVVDIDEVAPFGKSPFFAYDNITNNFVSADGWPLIINFPINKDNSPFDIPIALQKPQTITEFTWVGNVLYYPQTRLNLIFDGPDGKKVRVELKVEPNAEPQTFRIDPPRTARNLTVQVAEWIVKPNMTANIGVDNIYLKAQRPPGFAERVRPMLNVGGMVEYPRGAGGIVLCNLNFKEAEEVPENANKKRSILATLLRNLKAPFSSGSSVIAGANLKYTPIDLSKQANAFRDEKGWFGDKRFTFKDLPTGKHTFAGVLYDVYDFPTSPVPTAIVLAANGVPGVTQQEVKGIAVNRKASALFFLQAARIDARRNRDEIKQGKKYEMARYVVHYADGQTADVPVYAEIDVEDYRQKSPLPIPGAQIAWTQPYAGTDQTAVAYSKQWDNPRPTVPIQSIDLVYGPESVRGGVPALLAITAAE